MENKDLTAISRIEKEIEKITNKQSNIYFFVLDTKGNPSGSLEYIYKLAENACKTGEPITRHLAYEYPNEGFEREMTAFMLGDKYLVAPVLEKGVFQRTVRLPQGKWEYIDGEIFDGGKEVTVDAPLDTLPYFKKV